MNNRAGFSLDLDDIEGDKPVVKSVSKSQKSSKPESKNKDKCESKPSKDVVRKAAEASGFHDRPIQSRKSRLQVRKNSPYQIQFNLKVRYGMKELFNDLGEKLDTLNNATFEMAVEALIEKEGLKGSQIDKRFKKLLED